MRRCRTCTQGEIRQTQYGHQRQIHQWSGRNAPQVRARPCGRVHVCDAAQRPQDDSFRASTDLPAGQRMTELMQGDDREYRHVFQDAPAYRRISALLLNLVNGHEKPGPVEKYGDSCNLEEANRSCGVWHCPRFLSHAAKRDKAGEGASVNGLW